MERVTNKIGFSLVELLVAISIAGILLALVYVNFQESRASTRDKVRQTTLSELQLGLEQFRLQNGRYPGWSTSCTGAAAGAWISNDSVTAAGSRLSGSILCSNLTTMPFITSLAPAYVPALPNPARREARGFYYQTNSDQSAYKVLVYNQVESTANQLTSADEEFSECPSQCTGQPCNNRSTTFATSYAVYSPGAECW